MKPISQDDHRRIARLIGDPMLLVGHPLTCNGGNMDWRTHHGRVEMMQDERGLVCPECGRVQEIPAAE